MKQLFVSLMIIFPVAVSAQGTVATETERSAPNSQVVFLQPSNVQSQAPARPPEPRQNPEPQRPKSEGSMVGYIDNAIVGSQLRFRFDAGFHDEFPDRAEFFYAKCGCYRGLAGNPAYDPNAPGPSPGVAKNVDFRELSVMVEYAAHRRLSLFGEIPVRWLRPQAFVAGTGAFPNQSGVGDIRAGFKLGAVASENRYLTFQFRVDTKTGDESQGLGTGHTTVAPALLYYERLSPRAALEGEFAYLHPIGGSIGIGTTSNANPEPFAGDVLFYGFGPSYRLFSNGRVAFGPVIELAGWHVRNGWQTNITSTQVGNTVGGTNIVNLKGGFRTRIGQRNSIYTGYGQALTHNKWYNNIVRVEYRYSF